MAQLLLTRNETRAFVIDSDSTITCPRCHSTKVEITPAVAWTGYKFNHTIIENAVKACRVCGHLEPLWGEENLQVAKYVLNSEKFSHDERVAASRILGGKKQ